MKRLRQRKCFSLMLAFVLLAAGLGSSWECSVTVKASYNEERYDNELPGLLIYDDEEEITDPGSDVYPTKAPDNPDRESPDPGSDDDAGTNPGTSYSSGGSSNYSSTYTSNTTSTTTYTSGSSSTGRVTPTPGASSGARGVLTPTPGISPTPGAKPTPTPALTLTPTPVPQKNTASLWNPEIWYTLRFMVGRILIQPNLFNWAKPDESLPLVISMIPLCASDIIFIRIVKPHEKDQTGSKTEASKTSGISAERGAG